MTEMSPEINNSLPARKKRWGYLLLIPVVLVVLSGVVMLLWNTVLAPALAIQKLSLWQAMGLLVLCRILFGGFRLATKKGRASWSEKCQTLDEHQKARLKTEWQKRCGSRKI